MLISNLVMGVVVRVKVDLWFDCNDCFVLVIVV